MNGFSIFNLRITPDKQIGLHSQDTYELSWIKSGSGTRTIGQIEMPFNVGDLVLIPPHVAHYWQFSDKDVDSEGYISNVSCMFTINLLKQLAMTFPETSEIIERVTNLKNAILIGQTTRHPITDTLDKLCLLNPAYRPPLIVELMIRLGETINDAAIIPIDRLTTLEKRKADIIAYIACNSSKHISLSDAASYAGMNRSAFCKFFQRNFGITFVTYLNRIRIEDACQQLKTSDLSVSEIAYRAGFNNVPYFNRTFKSLTGFTPKSYKLLQ